MVEWGVARQIARVASRSEESPDLGLDVTAMARGLEEAVIAHTGLRPEGAIPPVEVVTREEWAAANLTTLAEMLEPVTNRLDERLTVAGPLTGVLRAGTGVTLATQVGLLSGYLARHVLGQYELSLLAPAARPRLLLVALNLDRAARSLDVDRDSFLRWVTIHELVHALQFGGVPWLRGHLGGLLREYIDTVDADGPAASGRLPALPGPTELLGRLREGGVGALVQSPAQRDILERVQVAMAVVEGHAEHVMDALGPDLVPQHAGLRAALERRRADRPLVQRILMQLIGMDMKMRQYRDGKAFCDAVAAKGGPAAFVELWRSPGALPAMDELTRPELWLERIAAEH